jgi:FtsZ-interacting cell division protein YlmF
MYYLGLTEEQDLTPEVTPEPVMEAVPSTGTVRVDSGASAVPGRRIEPPANRGWSGSPVAAEEARLGDLGTVRAVTAQDTHAEVLVAEEFEDAKRMADYLRDRLPVVLDLRSAGPDTVRRLVDFCSGITYALDGSMTKINTGVILVSPPRVAISREERRRLADLGLYALEDVN